MTQTENPQKQRILSLGDAIREALSEAVARDENVFLLGQGMSDPSSYWGTAKGIAERFGAERVVEMPLSENALTGAAVGAAMSGQRPVVSMHRMEFSLLAIEQIVNNAAKAHYTSAGRHRVPMVIRMVIGRGWGQGPEHSQSFEGLFAYFPGLKVVMPTFAADAKGMLIAAIEDDNPVIFIEHRWLHYAEGHVPEGYYRHELDGPRIVREGSDVTIVATSYPTVEAVRAADILTEVGCSAEVIDLRVLRPLYMDRIIDSVRRTGRLLTVDTGHLRYGVGAEIVASATSTAFDRFKAPPRRLGLPEHPTPSSRGMVPGYYPDAERILQSAGELAGLDDDSIAQAVAILRERRGDLPIDVPNPFFKGPF